MLIKIGDHRINLSAVACVTENNEGKAAALVRFVSGDSIELKDDEAALLINTWDKWAQFQADAQYVNEYNASAAIEQIKEIQKRGGIVQPVPAMPQLRRNRG